MISIPVAVHTDLFKWQLDLLWHTHKCIYGDLARDKLKAIVIKRNEITEPKHERLEWSIDVPHVMCEAFFDYFGENTLTNCLHQPLNIQIGLTQMIDGFDNDQLIEVLDCDMFHLKAHPEISLADDQLLVCNVYEDWHLKSLTTHRYVVEMYFENGGRFYNGGFVPIIGTVRTLKEILPEWIAVHQHILSIDYPALIHWWAGMFALQVACEKKKVQMMAADYCYVPGHNELQDHHYICHYCCDSKFDKKRYPYIDKTAFENNLFYRRILDWPRFLR